MIVTADAKVVTIVKSSIPAADARMPTYGLRYRGWTAAMPAGSWPRSAIANGIRPAARRMACATPRVDTSAPATITSAPVRPKTRSAESASGRAEAPRSGRVPTATVWTPR